MPRHAVGFWFDPNNRRCPPVDPTRLVDPAWASDDRDRIVAYLRQGLCERVAMGFSHCRFHCGIPSSEMGSAEYNDGTWAWPEGLAHYLEAHMIALPAEFLAHVRANNYEVPQAGSWRRFLADLIPWIRYRVLGQRPDTDLSFTKWEAWARDRNALE